MPRTFDEEKQNKKLSELHYVEAEKLAQTMSSRLGLPYIDLSKFSINTDALRLIDEELAKEAHLAGFKIIGKNLSIATTSPQTDAVQKIIADLENKGYRITVYLASKQGLDRVLERYSEISKSKKSEAGTIDISNENIQSFLEEFKQLSDITAKLEEENNLSVKQGGISSILEIVLSGALAIKASDIHIEPEEEEVRLRYRIDGVLQDITNFDTKIYKPILSRIKLVSGLKLNIKQTAQDGRLSIKVGTDKEIEIRTSIIPGAYGESIVMRVLNPDNIKVSFDKLGIPDKLLEIFDREIHKPNGLILLTGPTGSGKTTTLYSFLGRVKSTENKIITIEDPIEYHLKGISQTQVNRQKGYTFLSGLRSALRQDPDIIMVGEIRDSETAKIAINSALTGHLVFSTLHTNNSAGTIPRLIDLGVNAKIISSALTLSIAQRLIRKLCVDCKKEVPMTEVEKDIITKVLASIKKKQPDFISPEISHIYEPVGCPKCNNTGFAGRLGVFEAIYMDKNISAVTVENPNEKDIKIAAIPQGILDMRQDGILKIIDGITSFKELARVVDLNEEII